MSANVLLISVAIIKERTQIHDNIDEKLLYPEIKVAQDMYIHPILGTALFRKIQNDVATGTIAGAYKELLDDYIIDALIFYVLSELPQAISYQFWNKGVVRKQGENTELPSMSELFDISNNYKKKAEFYANRLTLFLKQKASELFLEYINPGSGLDDIHPAKNAFTMPVYLGNDCDCNKTFEEK